MTMALILYITGILIAVPYQDKQWRAYANSPSYPTERWKIWIKAFIYFIESIIWPILVIDMMYHGHKGDWFEEHDTRRKKGKR